jgi:hypothetical protein
MILLKIGTMLMALISVVIGTQLMITVQIMEIATLILLSEAQRLIRLAAYVEADLVHLPPQVNAQIQAMVR